MTATRFTGRGTPLGGQGVVGAAGLAVIGAYVTALAWAMQNVSYDYWGGMLLFPLLAAISIPLVWRVSRDDPEPMPALMAIAVVAKLAAALPRYFVIFQVYGGFADAPRYHAVGSSIAERFHAGGISMFGLIPHSTGTTFIEELTGFVYTFLGPTKVGGFMFFSWMGFWGLFLMYRAALIGFPEIDARRYAYILFFAPSMLFCPSSLGKESWMMLALGVTFYGAARFLNQMRGGIPLALLGSVMSGYVRPHVTAVVVVALGAAALFQRSARRAAKVSVPKKLVGILVLAIGISVAVGRAATFLGTDSKSGVSKVTTALDRVKGQTTQGGSAFETERPNSPLQYPRAFLSVMFRPTLIEVRNGTSLIAALETTALFALFVSSWRRLKAIPVWLFKRPYLLFCLLYVGIFAFAWSSVGNLGIVARQRVLAWPFAFVFLALPDVVPGRRESGSVVGATNTTVFPLGDRTWDTNRTGRSR